MTCLVWSLACYLHTRKWTLASCNIESDNVDDLEIRPVKKAKCSISSEFESDKQKNECDPSLLPTSPKEDSYSVESTDFESDKQMNEGDPSLLPPSPKANSYKVESSDFELDKQMNEGDPSLLPPSPKADSYSVESSGFESDKLNDKRLLLDDFLQPEEHEKSKVDETYDHLPEDYEMTDLDCCAQIAIESASATDIRVKIDDIFVTQEQLLCLLDPEIFLNDDVISAYICCIKDQARQLDRNDVKFYFENPFISMVLKGAGNLGMNKDSNYITNIVRDYLKHEMVLIPINIKSTHWYLAIINTQKCEIQVLDSLCWNFNRADLTATLQGIQYHLDIIKKHDHHVSHNWKNLQITKWTITEALQEPLQKDGYSCGLFLLKFMEYWTGDTLSHRITQESIDNFRYKLAGILLCWKTNTAGMANNFGQNDGTEADCNDVTILESPNGQKECQTLDSLSAEMKYGSLMSVLSKMSVQELVGGLCDYVKSINCTETLDKVWVRNSKPYSISLTLKTLQEILKEDQPMDRDCFNLVVRNFMSNDNQVVKKNKGTISKHYLDLRFWTITDFGRHPNFRKKLDMEKLADSVGSWPGINYCVSRCKLILMPIESDGTFILVILNKDNRTVYILDPTRLDPIYKYNPNAKYVKKLLWIAEYLSKAMSKAYPGSKWNEDVFLWRQIILSDVPTQSRELSGFLVSLFMCSWKNEELRLPILKDGYELRRQLLAQLLMCKENECEDNMPSGVRDFLSCINTDEIWK